MDQRVLPAVSVIVVGLVLMVPFVAVRYRRRGALGVRPAVLGFAARSATT